MTNYIDMTVEDFLRKYHYAGERDFQRIRLPPFSDLSGKHFYGVDFTGAWLPHVNFSGSVFERRYNSSIHCIFDGAHLERANFENTHHLKTRFNRAMLENSSFKQSGIRETNFEGAYMVNSLFGPGKTSSGMEDYTLIYQSWFDNAVLQRADFTRVRLTEVSFDRADLTDACFKGAIEQKCSFEGAILLRTTGR